MRHFGYIYWVYKVIYISTVVGDILWITNLKFKSNLVPFNDFLGKKVIHITIESELYQ